MPTKLIALIPARGGSKGLPGKNLYPLNGKPLIEYTIDAALASELFSEIVVSSDDLDILAFAQNKNLVALSRPAALATDLAPTDVVIEHVITELGLSENDVICLLQPTSPLRHEEHIKAAWSLFQSKDCHGVISVYVPDKTPFKAYLLNKEGYLTGLVGPDYPYTPRQSLPETYYPNGAIYLFSVASFQKQMQIPREDLIPFVMSQEDSIDIDTIEDIKTVERILRSGSGA